MTTGALLAQGTQLLRAGVAVLELNKLDWDGPEADIIDVTHTDSGDFKEKIKGLLDAKSVSLEGNLRLDDSTGQMALWTDLKTRTPIAFTIQGPSTLAFSFTFNGLVKIFKPILPLGGDNKPAGYKIEIEITGEPLLALTMSGDLTGLVITTGTLTPGLTAGTYDYGAALGAVSSVTITPTKAAATIKIYVNGVYSQTVSSGSASSAIATPVGTTKLIISTQDSGKVARNYYLNLYRTS